jgi:hypothetical protein
MCCKSDRVLASEQSLGKLKPTKIRHSFMFIQLFIGTILMLVSIFMAGVTFLVLEMSIQRLSGWLRREPHSPKLLFLLSAASSAILAQVTLSVWLWALVMWALELFETIEMAVYFALTCFTTLGFGDVLLPHDWELLGGLAATNGLLNIGFTTAVMVETMRYIRKSQIESTRPPIG